LRYDLFSVILVSEVMAVLEKQNKRIIIEDFEFGNLRETVFVLSETTERLIIY